MANPLKLRRAGIILHPTSLPGPQHCGSLGAAARHWIDWLEAAGFGIWQFLPLTPVTDGSPYNSFSAFAGNPYLIDLEEMQQWGFPATDLSPHPTPQVQLQALLSMHQWFEQHKPEPLWQDLQYFSASQHWLEDYCLFSALRDIYQSHWVEWPAPLRDREPAALHQFAANHQEQIRFHYFIQFIFFRQWQALKHYANRRKVLLFGDAPIFVAHDSADVWMNRHLFKLDATGNPLVVAGVPPDYFSATGQRWGNPLYDWAQHAEENYRWWQYRIDHALALYDAVRIDHFRGFAASWEIPAHEQTAINGQWVKAPGEALFEHLRQTQQQLPMIAEDLGVITPDVTALRKRYRLPGMKILQFAFDSDSANPYLPHHHTKESVVYTGTHDNNTTMGWYAQQGPAIRERIAQYYGYPQEPMPWPLIRSAMASSARWAIMPLQDVLALGREHRMNTPGTTEGNWHWRFAWHQISEDLAPKLKSMNQLYHRHP